jgi:hypothetical protein
MSSIEPNQRFSNPLPFPNFGSSGNRCIDSILQRFALKEAAKIAAEEALKAAKAAEAAGQQTQPGHTQGAQKSQAPPAPFDWDQCKAALRTPQAQAIATERDVAELTIEGLRTRDWFGSCYVTKWKEQCIAFPIHDQDGNVVRAHCRSAKPNAKGKLDWTYEPPVGESPDALIWGQLATAHTVYLAESQWDLIALIDKLDLFGEIDSGEICLIATRGAGFSDRLSSLTWDPGTEFFAFPQNDKRGGEWLVSAAGSLNGAPLRVVITPGQFNGTVQIKDVNEWTKAGARKAELVQAITDAAVYQAPSAEDLEDQNDPNWEKEVQEVSIDELLAFDRTNDPDNLIGNRWLCRGDTVVVQGETGVGKSVLVMQMIICWAMHLALFGIMGKRSLKSLLIESENNKGDLAEVFQDVTKAMCLRPDQIAYLKTKIVIVRECAKTGDDFLKLARRLIKKHKPDLVFADPLLSYLGGNISDQELMSAFLRNNLQPIVQKTMVVWFWVHHFGKPSKDGKPGSRNLMYSALGSVELPGWARETITLNILNADEHVGELEFGKRSRRVGLADDAGNPVYKVCIKQSKSGVLWELADPTTAKKAVGAAAKHGKAAREIRDFIEKYGTVTHSRLRIFAKQIPIGENPVIDIARVLVEDKADPRIYEYPLKGRTNRSLAFSTIEQALNPLAASQSKRKKRKAKSPRETKK